MKLSAIALAAATVLAVPGAGALANVATQAPVASATAEGGQDAARITALARAAELTAGREQPVPAPAERASRSAAKASTATTQPKGSVPKATARNLDEYVSLGDSWSADVVIADTRGLPDSRHAPIDCAQSKVNYPKLLAKELGITNHRDATCGSATTDDFWTPQERLPLGGTNPAQFDRLSATTDLVTVGIGGNDAGVASAAIDCFGVLPRNGMLPVKLPFGGCKDKYAPEGGEDRLARQIEAAEPKLVAALAEIHRRSPEARVLVVDYLNAAPAHACYPFVPISEEDMQYLHATMLRLNAMVKRAAEAGGAEFVDTYTPSIGHDICQLPHVRYVEVAGPSVNGPAVGVPAHPNSAGAAAQFRAVLAQVRRD